jgi:hypothetical protein
MCEKLQGGGGVIPNYLLDIIFSRVCDLWVLDLTLDLLGIRQAGLLLIITPYILL